MTNIYRGNLIIPVRTVARSPAEALELNKAQARASAIALYSSDGIVGVMRDTYNEAQASVQNEPTASITVVQAATSS